MLLTLDARRLQTIAKQSLQYSFVPLYLMLCNRSALHLPLGFANVFVPMQLLRI
jgi:hypothetical protein